MILNSYFHINVNLNYKNLISLIIISIFFCFNSNFFLKIGLFKLLFWLFKNISSLLTIFFSYYFLLMQKNNKKFYIFWRIHIVLSSSGLNTKSRDINRSLLERCFVKPVLQFKIVVVVDFFVGYLFLEKTGLAFFWLVFKTKNRTTTTKCIKLVIVFFGYFSMMILNFKNKL